MNFVGEHIVGKTILLHKETYGTNISLEVIVVNIHFIIMSSGAKYQLLYLA